jgi:hypothetical protein
MFATKSKRPHELPLQSTYSEWLRGKAPGREWTVIVSHIHGVCL